MCILHFAQIKNTTRAAGTPKNAENTFVNNN